MPPELIAPLDRWKPAAWKLPSDDLKVTTPFHVLMGESVDVARFHKKYYASVPAQPGEPERPGLDTVDDPKRHLGPTTGADLLSLREATQQAHTLYLLAASPAGVTPLERARFLLQEISAVLDFKFDDGVEDEHDAQLDAVETTHADTPDSTDAIAAELEDYTNLASTYRDEIDGLGGFDAKLLDEAKTVAETLRNRPPTPTPLNEKAAKALALRNRLATLLHTRMATVRSAARFVFRHHPNIIREATSAYERRRAAARRRALKKKAPAKPE